MAFFSAPGDWFICMLLVFGVSDCIARALASRLAQAPPSQALLLGYAVLRFALVPLIRACACGALGDAALAALVAALAGTGGHLPTLVMMHAPRLVDEEDRETAGTLLVAALHVGIVAGSNLALVFEHLPC